MIISEAGIALIKSFEGFCATEYICPGGKRTIGYGHALADNEAYNHPLTRTEADILLKQDIKIAENAINKNVELSLSQGKFDALVSLVFNWGVTNFINSKGLIYLNNDQIDRAADEFFSQEKGVNKVNGQINFGLCRRRQAERRMWDGKSS